MSAQAKSVVPYSTQDYFSLYRVYTGSSWESTYVHWSCYYTVSQNESLCASNNEFLSMKAYVLLVLYCSPEIILFDAI